MSGIFGELHSAHYDTIYGVKPYNQEIDAVLRLAAKHGLKAARSVLDLGCGTGRHAEILMRRGYRVTGIDNSEAMLSRARARIQGQAGAEAVTLECADICKMSLDQRFDLVVMMFNVLGYMRSNDALLQALSVVGAHLAPGGIFVCDFWYGPAICRNPPKSYARNLDHGANRIRRTARALWKPHAQSCKIDLQIEETGKAPPCRKVSETHDVRYFFPLELDLALRNCDLRLLEIRGFPRVHRAPSSKNWGAVLVATGCTSEPVR